MVFSSVTFLYYFLPITLLIYYIAPRKLKNFVLLIASLIFYFAGEGVYTWLLLFSSLSDYLHSLLIEKYRGQKKSKYILISSIVINLAMLGYFKYTDFFIGNINNIFGLNIPLLKVSLPIGISFFTFQTMSYTIDVYRGRVKAQKNLISMATFVCLFPQLVAGPIVRYSDIETQIDTRKETLSRFAEGTRRFITGLAKKVLIANNMGQLANLFYSSGENTVLFAWIYAVSFTLQIYFDFSGYSDMAVGLGKMFGFDFPENFDYPYISKSITEFWRRWHMTLGGWFRDYVYIPLWGNRVSAKRLIFNIAAVWLLTGFWHGAAWNFILWGGFFGLILTLEKRYFINYLQKAPKIIPHIYTLFIVLISFVLFNASSVQTAFKEIGMLFGIGTSGLYAQQSVYYLKSYIVLILIGLIFSTPYPKRIFEKCEKLPFYNVVQAVVLGVLLIICTGYIVDGSYNPFLYFRF